MNKYENALVEILNGLGNGNYNLYPIEVKGTVGYKTKYILSITTDYDEAMDIKIELSEESYNLLLELDKQINGKEE